MDERTAATDGRAAATDGGGVAGDLDERLGEIEQVAPAVAPIVEAAIRRPDADGDVLAGVDGDLVDVVMDQRAAMVRAVELRDDPSLSEDERRRWATVVERLAEARHEAKRELADRRREDPTEEGWIDAVHDREAARAADHDPNDLAAHGAPDAPGEHSGRGEPAPWQDASDRTAPEAGAATAGMGPRETDQLTSGPGLAGGTGGAGSQNYPADTGARRETPPLVPNEDVEPPDVAHR
jgi:hypothetical protein